MQARAIYLGAALIPLFSSGCIIGGFGSKVWTPPVTEERTIDATDMKALEIRTHNGSIDFTGLNEAMAKASITITTKAGGRTIEDAEAAFDAVDVFVEPVGDGEWRMGWRWDGVKRWSWNASVSFDITAPGNVTLDGETHNGPVRIEGARKNIRVVTHNGSVTAHSSHGELYARTHNGPVEVSAGGEKLHAETHNGRVTANFSGEDLTLVSHNGRIKVGLENASTINGKIKTHNGGIELTVSDQVSTNLDCYADNGGIHFDTKTKGTSKSKRHLEAKLGSGDGQLTVRTHNGGVRIKGS